jgi:hypothetical protein
MHTEPVRKFGRRDIARAFSDRWCVWLLLLVHLLLAAPGHAQQETGALPLDATFLSAGETLSFDYPAAWFTRESGEVVVIATDAPLLATDAPLDFGQMRATLTARPKTRFMPDVEPGAPLEAVVEAILAPRNIGSGCDPAGTPQPLTVHDHPALRVDQTCGFYETIFLVVDLDNDLVGVIAGETPLGGRAKYAATLAAIAGTIDLRPPGAVASAQSLFMTQSFSASGFRFTYPEGWTARAEIIGGAAFTLLSRADTPFRLPPLPGQPVAIVDRGSLRARTAAPPADDPVQRPLDVLAAHVAERAEFSPPEPFQLANRPAGRAYADFGGEPAMQGAVYVRMLDDDAYGYIEAYAAAGELQDSEPVWLGVLASLETASDDPPLATPTLTATVTAADTPDAAPTATPAPTDSPGLPLDVTYRAPDETFGFNYPSGWTVSGAGGIVIITAEDHRAVLTLVEADKVSAADVLRSRAADVPDLSVRAFALAEVTAAEAALPTGETLLVKPLDDGRYVVLTVIGSYAPNAATLQNLLASVETG